MVMQRRQRGRVAVEPCPKRVRAYLGGALVADTTHALLVWEVPYYPAFYVPHRDVHAELVPNGESTRLGSRGEASGHDVLAGGRRAAGAAWSYEDSLVEEIRRHVRFEWEAMDAWFEEDEEVFTHPRDPYTRVDVLTSSRHVRVEVDGVSVAESTSPRILFETGLPARYYLPKTDVRMDLLDPTESVTYCPYKGRAEWWSLRAGDGPEAPVHADLAWGYRFPLPESIGVAGLVCFYNEKVDLYVDGELQARPHTKFS